MYRGLKKKIIIIIIIIIVLTRSVWQSPTWGRPAPQVRSKSEVVQNWPKFCMFFWPPFFLGGGSAPNFWRGIIKYGQIPIIWQSFRAIGRGTSEISWRKKEDITGKKNISPSGNWRSGRPNNDQDNVYGALIVLRALREFTRFTRWMQHSATWPPTFRPSRLAWACSLYRPRQLGNYVHNRHLLLLLSSKANK